MGVGSLFDLGFGFPVRLGFHLNFDITDKIERVFILIKRS